MTRSTKNSSKSDQAAARLAVAQQTLANPNARKVDRGVAWMRVHRRRVIFLFWVAVLVGLTGSIGAWRYMDYRLALRDMRLQGFEAMAAGDPKTALDRLTRYVADRHDDVNALHKLAQAQLEVAGRDQAGMLQAVSTLEQILDLDPAHYLAKRSLLEVYARLNFREEAQTLAEDLLVRHPRDPMPFQVLVGLASARGDHAEVIERAQRVLENELIPESFRDIVLLTLARAELARNSVRESLVWIERCLKLSPTNLEAQFLYLRLAPTIGYHEDQILTHAASLYEQAPDQPRHGLLLATAHRVAASVAKSSGFIESEKQHLDDAHRVLTALTERELNPAELRMLLDELRLNGSDEDALSLLGEQAGRSDAPWVSREYIRRCIVLNRPMLARQRLDELVAEEGWADADSELLGMAVIVESKLRDPRRVQEHIERLQGRPYDAQALAWLALLPNLGISGLESVEIGEHIDLLRKALQEGSRNPILLASLGSALINQGQHAEGQGMLLRSAALAPYWSSPLLMLGRELLNTGRPREGLRVAHQALQRDPNNQITQSLLLHAIINNLSTIPSERLLAMATALGESDGKAKDSMRNIYRSAMLAAGGDLASAKPILEEMARDAVSRRDVHLLMEMTKLARRWFPNQEAELMAQALALAPDQPSVVLTEAYRLLRTQGRSAALAFFEDARAGAKNPDSLNWSLAWPRLLMSLQDPRWESAWTALMSKFPDEPAVARAILSDPVAMAHADFARFAVEQVASPEDRADLPIFIRLTHDLTHSLDPTVRRQASLRLERLVQANRQTVHIDALGLLAAVKSVQSDFRGEAQLLAMMIESADVPSQTYLQLSERLRALNQEQQAMEVLRYMASRSRHDDLGLARAAASRLSALGQPALGLELLRGRLPQGEGAPTDYQLGELMALAGQTEEALAMADALSSDSEIQSQTEAARLFSRLGETERAGDAWTRAETLEASDPSGTTSRILAQAYRQAGRPDQAIRMLATAAQKDRWIETWQQYFSLCLEYGQIETAVRQVPEAETSTESPGRFRIITDHADLLLSASEYEIDRLISIGVMGLPHIQRDTIAVLEALRELRQIDRQQAGEPLSRITDVADRQPMTLGFQIAAINSLILHGRVDQALPRIERALINHPRSPLIAKWACQALADEGQTEQAMRYARVWRSRALDLHESDLWLIRLMTGTYQGETLAERLTQYTRQIEQAPAARPRLSYEVARAMMLAGRTSWVERWLLPWANQDTRGALVWTDLASHLNSAAEVEAWLTRLPDWDKDEPLNRATQIAWAQFNAGLKFEEPAMISAGEARITRLLDQNPLNPLLLTQRGFMAGVDGRPDEALAYLERIDLQQVRPIQRVSILNNMAMYHSRLGQNEPAIRFAELAYRLQPENGNIQDTLALVLADAGKLQDAYQYSRRAVLSEPDKLSIQLTYIRLVRELRGDAAAAERLREIDRRWGSLKINEPALIDEFEQLAAELGVVRRTAASQ